jgi:hypothetical protein
VSFYFNKKFLKNNYKLCENYTLKHEFSSASESSLKSFMKQCLKICKLKCHSVNFDTKIQVSKHFSNKTIFEFIPMKTPRIACIETLKTDFDRLIYNCGGVLGLWFGITPIKWWICSDIYLRFTGFWKAYAQQFFNSWLHLNLNF